MVLGRLTFLKMNGISAVKGVTSIVLENIYMLVALGIMSLLALPFLGSDIPGALIIALWISAGLSLLMLFAPGIQKMVAKRLARNFDVDMDELPHISHTDQAKFVGATYSHGPFEAWPFMCGSGASVFPPPVRPTPWWRCVFWQPPPPGS